MAWDSSDVGLALLRRNEGEHRSQRKPRKPENKEPMNLQQVPEKPKSPRENTMRPVPNSSATWGKLH